LFVRLLWMSVMMNTQRYVSVIESNCALASVIHDISGCNMMRAFDVTSSRHLLLARGSTVAYPIMISVAVFAGSQWKHNAYWITCYNSGDLVLIVSDAEQRSRYYSIFTHLSCSVRKRLCITPWVLLSRNTGLISRGSIPVGGREFSVFHIVLKRMYGS
jgi:hypothetical protein